MTFPCIEMWYWDPVLGQLVCCNGLFTLTESRVLTTTPSLHFHCQCEWTLPCNSFSSTLFPGVLTMSQVVWIHYKWMLVAIGLLTFETIVASDFGNEKYACSNRAFGSRAESAVTSLKILCEWCGWISDEKCFAFSCRYLSCCGSTGFNISYPGSQHCRSRTLQHCSWCAENIAGQTVQLNLWGKW